MLEATPNSSGRASLESADLNVLLGSRGALAFASQLIRSWRAMLALQTEAYRPEAHYMRGPGPKCRAKFTHTRNAAL